MWSESLWNEGTAIIEYATAGLTAYSAARVATALRGQPMGLGNTADNRINRRMKVAASWTRVEGVGLNPSQHFKYRSISS